MDATDFLTADFQRVNISGEDSSGVPVEDLHSAAELLTRALNIREKYMRVSHQEFPANVERYNIYTSSQYLSSPLRAESARAFTGRRNSYSGRGEDFLTGQPDFFTETAVTPERKVEKWFPRWEINRHAEG